MNIQEIIIQNIFLWSIVYSINDEQTENNINSIRKYFYNKYNMEYEENDNVAKYI